MRCLSLLLVSGLLACSAAEKAPVSDESTGFETAPDQPLVEPEAGPSPEPQAVDAGETPGLNDAGPTESDAGAESPEAVSPADAGTPDAGSLKPEPELASPELKERFNKAWNLLPMTQRQPSRSSTQSSPRRLTSTLLHTMLSSRCNAQGIKKPQKPDSGNSMASLVIVTMALLRL